MVAAVQSRPEAIRAPRFAFDPVDLITVYLVALFVVPSRYVLPGIGGAGTPANLIGLVCLLVWVLGRAHPGRDLGSNPVRVAFLVFVGALLLTGATALARPIVGAEVNAIVRLTLQLLATVGAGLLALDGIRPRRRLDVLIGRLLNLGLVIATVGVLQFFTSFDPVQRIRVPLLQVSGDLPEISQRIGSTLNRVYGTTLHAIEFGSVLALLVPLALWAAIYGHARLRTWHWARFGVLAFALPLSLSRTAFVALGVATLVLLPTWTWRRRINLLAGGLAAMVAMRFVVPGLIGTIRGLFLGAPEDPSIQTRTADYDRVTQFVAERPVFGRGPGTLLPDLYFFLDNEFLMILVTMGIVGLVATVGLVAIAATVGRQVYWHSDREDTRQLGATSAAVVLGGFSTFFTFDALSFQVMRGTWFLMIGLCGALWAIEVRPYGRRYLCERSRPEVVPSGTTRP